MEQYNVTGMSCAACSARVEKAVSAVPGVQSCAVSMLTNSMGVEGTASEADIIKAVENAGYANDDMLKDTETPKLRKRLIKSVIVLLILMYFSMGHMMWGFSAPAAFDNHVFLSRKSVRATFLQLSPVQVFPLTELLCMEHLR